MREHRGGQPAAAIIRNECRQEKTTGLSDPVEVDSKFHAADPIVPRNVPLGFCAKIQLREDTWRSLSQVAQATSVA